MTSASESLCANALAALAAIGELNGCYDGPPLHAAFPHAIVEIGPETDWSHKNGRGRELRLALTIRDQGERPDRVRRLMRDVETALLDMARAAGDWRIVSLVFLRSRMVREPGPGWAGVSEFRARLLAL